MSARERLEEARRRIPATVGATAGLIADNPVQFAMIASGSYVVTRGLGRLVRPDTLGGVLMTAAASWGVCMWLLGEARSRGLIELKVRGPGGELVTLAELGELGEPCGCGRDHAAAAAPLIDLDAIEREVARRRAAPAG